MPYRDPPVDPKLFGWGDKNLQPMQNLTIEKASVGQLQEAHGIIVAADDAMGTGKMMASVEKALRSKFKFDEGWDFQVAERMVYGLSEDETLMIAQNIGNCVGNSHVCLIAARYAHEILAIGDAEEPLGKGVMGVPFVAFSYGAGRLAGNMLGPGDGSYCGAQIKGTMEYGFLPANTEGLDKYGSLPQGTSSAGRLFGRSKQEIMKWVPLAQKFDLLEAPECQSEDDCWDLIVNKHIPLQICSSWGFKHKGYDSKYGIELYVAGGSWSHSMQIIAAFMIKGERFYVIRNQWGYDAHKGSKEVGMTDGTFVISADTMKKWIKSSETLGIGAIKGLPSNPGFN